jgi:hypothetical protein
LLKNVEIHVNIADLNEGGHLVAINYSTILNKASTLLSKLMPSISYDQIMAIVGRSKADLLLKQVTEMTTKEVVDFLISSTETQTSKISLTTLTAHFHEMMEDPTLNYLLRSNVFFELNNKPSDQKLSMIAIIDRYEMRTGAYVPEFDTIISQYDGLFDIRALLAHELAHRFWYKTSNHLSFTPFSESESLNLISEILWRSLGSRAPKEQLTLDNITPIIESLKLWNENIVLFNTLKNMANYPRDKILTEFVVYPFQELARALDDHFSREEAIAVLAPLIKAFSTIRNLPNIPITCFKGLSTGPNSATEIGAVESLAPQDIFARILTDKYLQVFDQQSENAKNEFFVSFDSNDLVGALDFLSQVSPPTRAKILKSEQNNHSVFAQLYAFNKTATMKLLIDLNPNNKKELLSTPISQDSPSKSAIKTSFYDYFEYLEDKNDAIALLEGIGGKEKSNLLTATLDNGLMVFVSCYQTSPDTAIAFLQGMYGLSIFHKELLAFSSLENGKPAILDYYSKNPEMAIALLDNMFNDAKMKLLTTALENGAAVFDHYLSLNPEKAWSLFQDMNSDEQSKLISTVSMDNAKLALQKCLTPITEAECIDSLKMAIIPEGAHELHQPQDAQHFDTENLQYL